jgi:hypothetical protein
MLKTVQDESCGESGSTSRGNASLEGECEVSMQLLLMVLLAWTLLISGL